MVLRRVRLMLPPLTAALCAQFSLVGASMADETRSNASKVSASTSHSKSSSDTGSASKRVRVAATQARATPLPRKSTVAGKAFVKRAAPGVDAKADVALGGDMKRTRFLIGLPKDVEFHVFALSNPDRVIVELPKVSMDLPPRPQDNIAVGLVRDFQAGTAGPGKTRVVIHVTRPVIVESASLEEQTSGKGRRLALDIVPVERKKTKKAAKKDFKYSRSALGAPRLLQPPVPARAKRPVTVQDNSYKPLVVIDPGHGGTDTGAKKNGTVEKDVVLAFGLKLREKLIASGKYRVKMTRDKDEFVALGDRVKYAEKHQANLFIAVHADYAGKNSKARGATIYSLRDSVAKRLQRSEKGRANRKGFSKVESRQIKSASVEAELPMIKRFLSELMGREVTATRKRTDLFTRSVIASMGTSTEMRSNPDKQAAFRVLKTARFPSVLIELAFVTNEEDARLLRSDAWRDKVSDSIKTAVDNYFSNQMSKLPM